MTLNEQIARKVIENIHGLPYEEAVKKEKVLGVMNGKDCENPVIKNENSSEVLGYKGLPITIGRVMKALENKFNDWYWHDLLFGKDRIFEHKRISEDELDASWSCFQWKTTKENGQECTIEDQSEKTKEKLLELFNQ